MKKSIVIALICIFMVGTCLSLTARVSMEDFQTAADMITLSDPYGINKMLLDVECIGKIIDGYVPQLHGTFRVATLALEEDMGHVFDDIHGTWIYSEVSQEDWSQYLEDRELDTNEYSFLLSADWQNWVNSKNAVFKTWFDHNASTNFFSSAGNYSRMIIGTIILVVQLGIDSVMTIIPYVLGLLKATMYIVGL